MKYPESMEECVYFTRRTVDEGKVMAWVFRELCPKCKKSYMGKPVEKGKVKVRAKEYICPSCNHAIEKVAYEDTLTASIAYTCPKCKNTGEIQIPFKMKNYQGVKALVFQCQKCKESIPITKKMKTIGGKSSPIKDED